MKKTLLTSIICAISYGSLSVSVASSPSPASVVKQKFDAFNRHDVNVIESLYSPNAVLQSPDYPGLSGNVEIAKTYQKLFDAIPDAKDSVTQIDSIEHRVYAQFILTGHIGGDQNKPVSAKIISIYTVDGAHITADTTYYDRKYTP